MQLSAKLIQVLPIQSGMGRNGEWKKQDIVVETQDQYPKKICISIWGDKINGVQLNVGEMYTIDFDVESREYNGRWYTDVKAWKIAQQSNAGEPQDGPQPIPPAGPEDFPPFDPNSGDTQDLPF